MPTAEDGHYTIRPMTRGEIDLTVDWAGGRQADPRPGRRQTAGETP